MALRDYFGLFGKTLFGTKVFCFQSVILYFFVWTVVGYNWRGVRYNSLLTDKRFESKISPMSTSSTVLAFGSTIRCSVSNLERDFLSVNGLVFILSLCSSAWLDLNLNATKECYFSFIIFTKEGIGTISVRLSWFSCKILLINKYMQIKQLGISVYEYKKKLKKKTRSNDLFHHNSRVQNI